jgi:prepilin-type N-terminal cleavage/methylation domain-containing protein
MKLRFDEAQPCEERAESGFTLPEVMVSVVLVTIVVVSLYAGITQGFIIADVSRDNMRATQVMVNTMEVIRLYSWDQINSNGFIPTNYTISLYPTNRIAGTALQASADGNRLASINIELSTPALGTGYATKMKEIAMSVTWTNQGLVRTRSMRSFIAQEGLQTYVY